MQSTTQKQKDIEISQLEEHSYIEFSNSIKNLTLELNLLKNNDISNQKLLKQYIAQKTDNLLLPTEYTIPLHLYLTIFAAVLSTAVITWIANCFQSRRHAKLIINETKKVKYLAAKEAQRQKTDIEHEKQLKNHEVLRDVKKTVYISICKLMNLYFEQYQIVKICEIENKDKLKEMNESIKNKMANMQPEIEFYIKNYFSDEIFNIFIELKSNIYVFF
ncbi:hypothetical protein ACM9HF_05085 [Colwellia sp. RE-S-Sl-9]